MGGDLGGLAALVVGEEHESALIECLEQHHGIRLQQIGGDSLALQQEVWPFVYTVLLIILSYAGLGVMVVPALIPPSVTIFQSSSSVSSLVFMLTFIGVLIPIMLFYSIYNYIAFRGKVSSEQGKPLASSTINPPRMYRNPICLAFARSCWGSPLPSAC
jgi:hypothetical protein